MNFVSKVLQARGGLYPLAFKHTQYNGTGLFNPSIYNDDGTLLTNVRHCQYTIYHADKGRFEHPYGPLVYLNPENDHTLTTRNYLGSFNIDTQEFSVSASVDTSLLDKPPVWTFVGLEDVRIVRWDSKLYLCGVRRDTTTNGQGRMELSEVVKNAEGRFVEVSRHRIPAPGTNSSYCEKNWMPIVDMPFHFVKWTNPTEVVKFNIEAGTTETVFLGNSAPLQWDLRGGSQVISIGDYRVACVHATFLYKSEAGRKNARYRHCFVVWDKNWNIVRITNLFSFMDFEIEFCCGMTVMNDKVYVTFGIQDNAAFVITLSMDVFAGILKEG